MLYTIIKDRNEVYDLYMLLNTLMNTRREYYYLYNNLSLIE